MEISRSPLDASYSASANFDYRRQPFNRLFTFLLWHFLKNAKRILLRKSRRQQDRTVWQFNEFFSLERPACYPLEHTSVDLRPMHFNHVIRKAQSSGLVCVQEPKCRVKSQSDQGTRQISKHDGIGVIENGVPRVGSVPRRCHAVRYLACPSSIAFPLGRRFPRKG